jgi:hypothetical protein
MPAMVPSPYELEILQRDVYFTGNGALSIFMSESYILKRDVYIGLQSLPPPLPDKKSWIRS